VLYNATTVASIGTRRITQMSDLLLGHLTQAFGYMAGRTSENCYYRHFGE
jgi:hypothetical protein